MIMRKLRAALTAALLSTFGLIAAATPASAHADKVYQGRDFAAVSNGHLSGYVCDDERDGHDVWARWTSSDGTGSFTASPHGAGTCQGKYFDRR